MSPESSTTFTAARRTFGAMPTMPLPFFAAAMVSATWVPWSLVVGCQDFQSVLGFPPSMQEAESEVLVGGVDTGVEDADHDVPAAQGGLVRLVDADGPHVPLVGPERLGAVGRGGGRDVGLDGGLHVAEGDALGAAGADRLDGLR